jgi:hypothetical protein
MISRKQNVFIFKNVSAEYATLAALLKPLRTRRKPPNPNQKKIFSDEKFFNQDEKTNSQNDRYMCYGHEDVPIVMHNQD